MSAQEPNGKEEQKTQVQSPMVGCEGGFVVIKIPFADAQGKLMEAHMQVDPEGAESFATLLKSKAAEARNNTYGL